MTSFSLIRNQALEQGHSRFPFLRASRSDSPVRKWNEITLLVTRLKWWNGSVLRTDRTGSCRPDPVLCVRPGSFHATAWSTREMRGSFECRIFQRMVQNKFQCFWHRKRARQCNSHARTFTPTRTSSFSSARPDQWKAP